MFVGNLNFKTTSDQLKTYFEEVGEVSEVIIPTDRATGRPRGFAFVRMASADEAAEAIERFDGEELDGRPLRVSEATERSPRPPRAPRGDSASSFGGDEGGFDGFGGGGGRDKGGRPKGSRRNLRGKKRSL